MAKFRYKLQNILNIKLRIEDQKKIAYAIVQNELNEAEERLAYMNGQKLDFQEALKLLMNKKLDILQMKKCSQAIKTLETLIEIQENIIAEIKVRLEKARAELSKAMV